jgi:integrase/recombinase XerC
MARSLSGSSSVEALKDWLDYLAQERRASPRTVRAYGDNVSRYLGFLAQHRGGPLSLQDLGAVEPAELRAFLAVLRAGETPLSPRSLSQMLSSIRTFHRWLDRRLGVPNDALALVRGPRVKPGAPRPVSEDQAAGLILEAAGDDEVLPVPLERLDGIRRELVQHAARDCCDVICAEMRRWLGNAL